jgi:hypothetical protein
MVNLKVLCLIAALSSAFAAQCADGSCATDQAALQSQFDGSDPSAIMLQKKVTKSSDDSQKDVVQSVAASEAEAKKKENVDDGVILEDDMPEEFGGVGAWMPGAIQKRVPKDCSSFFSGGRNCPASSPIKLDRSMKCTHKKYGARLMTMAKDCDVATCCRACEDATSQPLSDGRSNPLRCREWQDRCGTQLWLHKYCPGTCSQESAVVEVCGAKKATCQDKVATKTCTYWIGAVAGGCNEGWVKRTCPCSCR